MKRIPIVTSLPPSTSRRDPTGREIGESYAQRCIASWRAAGFEPVTVNSRTELAKQPVTAQDVRLLAVDRDATALTGRPLVFLEDMLAAGLSLGSTCIALTNADILIDPPFDLVRAVSGLRPGEALISKRIDVARPEDRSGPTYWHGFDFFAVHREDLARIRSFGLVFGVPWWDHFLPMLLLLHGVELSGATEPFVFHLHHDEHWTLEIWHEVGWSYATQLADFIKREAHQLSSYPTRAFDRELSAALFGSPAELRFRAHGLLADLFPSRAPAQRRKALARFSSATVRFIDAHHHLLPGARRAA